MLARIRARGIVIGLTPQGGLMTSGQMSPAQRQYLKDHEVELLELLQAEDDAVRCVRCGAMFSCRGEGRYAEYARYENGEPGILCGSCAAYVDSVMARYEAGANPREAA